MAKRYDTGKVRMDLVPPSATMAIASVLTMGAEKYGDRNWEKGMKWSRCIGSMMRHMNAFLNGEDRDLESGLLHMAHVMCNASFLLEYYKTHPELDDRPKRPTKKIGLDIDDVLADFLGAYKERYGIERDIHSWYFDPNMPANMKELEQDKEFWLGLKPKIDPKTLPFEPWCYVTARSIDPAWTQEWLQKHGFPARPIHSVGFEGSKGEALIKSGCDWFVDDSYRNFVEINATERVCCFLLSTPQNRKFDVGFYRIESLDDLPK